MRALMAVFVSVMVLLTGCANSDAPIDKAIKLRNEIENSNGCAFVATVTADYGEAVYVFSMDCVAERVSADVFFI